ncbi:MAG: hypothetical protein VX293_11270 [Candidatus Latescibacterota bacterium]|nr:hypothetical protein [Candidatus Latescibacterota bacterium]
MWLGFSAAFIGMFYALVKFLTFYQLRQLNNTLISSQHESQKTQQRLEQLNEKLKIEHSKKRTIEHEIKDLAKRNDQLHARLQADLPKGILPQLKRCRALVAENTVREYKMLHDLQLIDRVSEALEPRSLLLVRFPPDEAGAEVVAPLVEALKIAEMSYHGPTESELVSYAANPHAALDLWQAYRPQIQGEALPCAVLYAGVQLTEEKSEINRLFARNLQQAAKLLDQAPAGDLLLNEAAYDELAPEQRQAIKALAPGLFLYRAKAG